MKDSKIKKTKKLLAVKRAVFKDKVLEKKLRCLRTKRVAAAAAYRIDAPAVNRRIAVETDGFARVGTVGN